MCLCGCSFTSLKHLIETRSLNLFGSGAVLSPEHLIPTIQKHVCVLVRDACVISLLSQLLFPPKALAGPSMVMKGIFIPVLNGYNQGREGGCLIISDCSKNLFPLHMVLWWPPIYIQLQNIWFYLCQLRFTFFSIACWFWFDICYTFKNTAWCLKCLLITNGIYCIHFNILAVTFKSFL